MLNLKEILYMKSDEQLASIASNYGINVKNKTKLQVIELIQEAISERLKSYNNLI